ncbi:unnamed protein product [Euphydryas editha]|uniref:Uncharacterized protein n=1 Tax=Euphydryas editha TaxID=104508 RepID=A0AAU9UHV8_EUPED|nr:unnamed protein product [Euphydryas editha]
MEAIKFISDGCRILSDLHHQQTETRKKFITPCLDKTFLQVVDQSERDNTLFGNNLSDKIKASKVITMQGQQIKKTSSTPKPSSSHVHTAHTSRNSLQGNWQTLPRSQANKGGRGGYKRNSQRQTPSSQQKMASLSEYRAAKRQ